jgi:hypothetical protein
VTVFWPRSTSKRECCYTPINLNLEKTCKIASTRLAMDDGRLHAIPKPRKRTCILYTVLFGQACEYTSPLPIPPSVRLQLFLLLAHGQLIVIFADWPNRPSPHYNSECGSHANSLQSTLIACRISDFTSLVFLITCPYTLSFTPPRPLR